VLFVIIHILLLICSSLLIQHEQPRRCGSEAFSLFSSSIERHETIGNVSYKKFT